MRMSLSSDTAFFRLCATHRATVTWRLAPAFDAVPNSAKMPERALFPRQVAVGPQAGLTCTEAVDSACRRACTKGTAVGLSP
jgi:hypothetical protein